MSYTPDPVVIPQPPYTSVFLSQRDLSLEIPINFVTVPGVSLREACFSHDKFEDVAFQKCVSNLIASGFRKLEVDLFWDERRWSFCPVKLPDQGAPTSSHVASTSIGSGSSIQSASTPSISAERRDESSLVNSLTASSLIAFSTASTSSAATSLPSIATNSTLVRTGPYSCTSTIDIESLLAVLISYIDKTETTLDANLIYLTFNLHAAASFTSPTLPAPSPAVLPRPGNLIGELVAANLTEFLYTPSNLLSDRVNLNNSWYKVSNIYRPVGDYYKTSKNINNIVSTEDGWPSESFIELTRSKRLLLQFGSNIDPQMAAYNFSGDDNVIFPPGYLSEQQTQVAANAAGNITQGCLLPSSSNYESPINSSFAAVGNVSGFDYPTSPSNNLTSILNLTTNLVNCGISPFLNASLLNVTADTNPAPYQNFSYASLWPWAPGEPSDSSPESGNHKYRCASTSTKLNGQWTTIIDCSNKLFAACRTPGNPYNFSLTTYAISYSFADRACQPLIFAVPRTSLENSFLTQTIRQARRDFDGTGVWVNWNSPVEGCWVSGNTTCPYAVSADIIRERSILIPSVAAIIVLVVTSLIIFAKISGNRKFRKRTTKRARNGFVYEGIPS